MTQKILDKIQFKNPVPKNNLGLGIAINNEGVKILVRCSRCKRKLKHPIYKYNGAYGPKCLSRVIRKSQKTLDGMI